MIYHQPEREIPFLLLRCSMTQMTNREQPFHSVFEKSLLGFELYTVLNNHPKLSIYILSSITQKNNQDALKQGKKTVNVYEMKKKT